MSALLQRNIGVNLFNLSETDHTKNRTDLKKALDSYFTSLDHLTKVGGNTKEAGAGLINLEVGLSETASQAASGFDKRGEEKLMFSYIANTYERLAEPGPAREYFEKKLALLNQSASINPRLQRSPKKRSSSTALASSPIKWVSRYKPWNLFVNR